MGAPDGGSVGRGARHVIARVGRRPTVRRTHWSARQPHPEVLAEPARWMPAPRAMLAHVNRWRRARHRWAVPLRTAICSVAAAVSCLALASGVAAARPPYP